MAIELLLTQSDHAVVIDKAFYSDCRKELDRIGNAVATPTQVMKPWRLLILSENRPPSRRPEVNDLLGKGDKFLKRILGG